MKKLIIFTLLICPTFNPVHSQDYWSDIFKGSSYGSTTELGAGFSTLYQTKLKAPLLGININFGMEGHEIWLGENYIETYTVFRTNYFFKSGIKKDGVFNAISIDTTQNLNPILVNYKYSETLSYFMIDIGKDYYLYTNKNEDFLLYSGFAIGINIANYIANYDLEEYNSQEFKIQTENDWEKQRKMRSTSLKLGLNIGFKYNVGAFSYLFMEATTFIDFLSNENIPLYYSIDNHFFVGLNLGYKYEF